MDSPKISLGNAVRTTRGKSLFKTKKKPDKFSRALTTMDLEYLFAED